jgi:hypothetical protein
VRLIRYRQAKCRQESSILYNWDDAETFRANFHSFGRGSERASDFGVQVQWMMLKALFGNSLRKKHPTALRLQAALRFAEAVEQAGWRDKASPQSN